VIPSRQFLDHVIRPTLAVLAEMEPRMRSPAAERLLLGTAVVESRLQDLVQKGGGPALSMFQIEPATFQWMWRTHVLTSGRLGMTIGRFLFQGIAPIDQLAGNQHLACAMARLRFWLARDPLPAADDIDGLGGYWKEHYNTRLGRGRAEVWVKDYGQYCAEAFR